LERRTVLLALTGCCLAPAALAQIQKIEPDPKAVKLCTDLLAALTLEGEAARLKAVLPLLHKSLLTADGKDLDPMVRNFSYKKAVTGAPLYKQPADIFEVHKGNDSTVGFGATAERGRTDKYFVNKKDGQPGRPAPLHVFWPNGGGEPKLVNIGSL
jgi:hypothetical protein